MPSGVYPRRPALERFWEKVDKSNADGCWPWLGSVGPHGYGSFVYPGEQRAHRASWILAFGPIPKGVLVLHKCDNRKCVRPSHLFLGNHKDNMQDAMAKGRLVLPPAPPGERNHQAKLSDDDVAFIRKNYRPRDKTFGAKFLAKRFGVSYSLIVMVGRNQHRSSQ